MRVDDDVDGYSGDRGDGAASLKWNSIGLIGRQLVVILFSFILARLVGPEAYGTVVLATTYVAFTTLLMDQGLSAALVSRRTVTRRLLGACVSLNLAIGLVLAAITVAISEPYAEFMKSVDLGPVLAVLGAGLILKALSVVPRALALRRLEFRALATAEIAGALAGALTGTTSALVGAEEWALVGQIIVADAVVAGVLLALIKPPLPNLAVSELRSVFGFSVRVFAIDLVNYATRNADMIAVGRFLGASQAGLYGLAYRTLLLPVQMVGQTVTRVIFPLVSRRRDDRQGVSALILECICVITLIATPTMGFISVASFDLIQVVLGSEWIAAAPALSILAITGARQAVTSLNSATVLGYGRADLQLKYTLFSAALQLAGIVGGLPFGIAGVAAGYTLAGFLIMPVFFVIQRHLVGSSIASQLASLWPGVHATLMAVVGYLLVSAAVSSPLMRIMIGATIGAAIYGVTLLLFHRARTTSAIARIRTVLRKSD